MFSPGSAKKLQRLFRDFPWLWAIRSDWDPKTIEIRVRHAHEVEDLWRTLSPSSESFKVWVHAKDDNGHEVVVPLRKCDSGKLTLAREVFMTSWHHGYTQHVVIECGNTVDVLREPGWGQEPIRSFDRFLEKGDLF